jgi:hypothetical protein
METIAVAFAAATLLISSETPWDPDLSWLFAKPQRTGEAVYVSKEKPEAIADRYIERFKAAGLNGGKASNGAGGWSVFSGNDSVNCVISIREGDDGTQVAARCQPTAHTLPEIASPNRPNHLSGISLADFLEIRVGMSMSEVTAILGAGELLSYSEVPAIAVAGERYTPLAGNVTSMYGWKNPGGGNMSVMFQNGRVVSKAQAGLPGTSSRMSGTTRTTRM